MSLTLQTQRLVLREPQAADWPAFRDFMFSDRAAAFGSHRDLGKTWKSFAAELGHWQIYGHGMWAVTRRGADDALGYVGPWTPAHWPEPEIGWMIFDPRVEGTGIAAEAASASIAHAFDVLSWETAVSYIAPGNTRSIRLAEKLGASLDILAEAPSGETLVYRHPRPGAKPGGQA